MSTRTRSARRWRTGAQRLNSIVSPPAKVPDNRLIGPLQSRTRRLNDAEIFALWRATGRMGYPAGSVYRLLLLTGLRYPWLQLQGRQHACVGRALINRDCGAS